MIGSYHHQGAPTLTAIKVINAREDIDLGIAEGEDFLYIFQYPAIVKYDFVDILGRQHIQAVDGAIIKTRPKFKGRFDMFWQVAEVSEVTGGIITAYKDVEFLLYLKNYDYLFSKGTGRYLRLMMHYDSSTGFPSEGDLSSGVFYAGERVFNVCLTGFTMPNNFAVGAMEVKAQFETNRNLDKIPYTIEKNRTE